MSQLWSAYRLTLDAIKPDSSEHAVQSLWSVITAAYFPSEENYALNFFGNAGMPTIKVRQKKAVVASPSPWKASDWGERQILQVEYRRPSEDTPANWSSMGTLNGLDKLFGAVAIGKRVRFFRFDGTKTPGARDRMVPLHLDPIDLGKPEGQSQLRRWMDDIKRDGWHWANSVG
ncbi:hypothetical protein BDW62DRAFT_203689 [Aspergillus aurantiobrunneus]